MRAAEAGVWKLELEGVASLQRPDGTVVALERKTAALLVLLAMEGPTRRSRLAGLLWPDVSETRARANLRQVISRLGKFAGRALVSSGDPLRLEPVVELPRAEVRRTAPTLLACATLRRSGRLLPRDGACATSASRCVVASIPGSGDLFANATEGSVGARVAGRRVAGA